MRARFRSSHPRVPFSGTSGEGSTAPERVVHFGRTLPIALIAALLIAGVAAIDVVPTSAAPTASVAKKKCSKKERKRLRCGRQTPAVAALTALFAGSSFSYSYPSGGSGSISEVRKYCRNGTYQGQYVVVLDSGETYQVITSSGTWNFTAAHVEDHGSFTSLDGTLHQTISSWQDSLGQPPSLAPTGFDGSVKHDDGASDITMGGNRWTISPGGAGC
jgi:hypothetical protein